MNTLVRIIPILFVLNICVPVIGTATVGVIKTGVQISEDPRTFGTIVDDNIIEKSFKIKITETDKKYFIAVKGKSLDGRFFIKGEVNSIDEKILMTKLAWETDGVRSVQNNITVKDETTWKDKAKDVLITSQLKVALMSDKNVKSGNFQITTVNQNIYIFGIARNEEERKLVINEANQINDVEEVVSSIFLVSDLTNNQRLKN